MSAFFPFELEPPPWLYRLLARLPLMQRLYRRMAADLATVPVRSLLLDIGAGPGHLLAQVAAKRSDLNLVALDRSLTMLGPPWSKPSAASNPQALSRIVGDATALPLRSACCDLAIATFSFHTWDQPVKGVQEMVRVVRPGGLVWIYEMNREASWEQFAALAREEALPVPLVAAGFKLLSWNHALRAKDLHATFAAAGLSPWQLEPMHHVFWRAVFKPGQPMDNS